MNNSPFTDIGRLEHEVSDIRRNISNKADGYEIRNLSDKVANSTNEINSRLDSMEYSVRELSTRIDEFLIRLQEVENESSE